MIHVFYDANWTKLHSDVQAHYAEYAKLNTLPWATLVPVLPGDPGPQMGLAVEAWSKGLTNVIVLNGFDIVHPEAWATHIQPHLDLAAQEPGSLTGPFLLVWTARPDIKAALEAVGL